MMGPTHALMGLTAGLATAHVVCTTPAEVALWATTCAGTSLLPDLDTPESLASRTWGRTTQLMANLVQLFARGHRKWSHHLIAAPVAAGVVWAASHTWVTSFVMCALLTALALTSITRIFGQTVGAPLNFAMSIAVAYIGMTRNLVDMQWLALAAAFGVIVHIAGDALTAGGVPGPLASSKRFRLTRIKTGGFTERCIIIPVLSVSALTIAAVQFVPELPQIVDNLNR